MLNEATESLARAVELQPQRKLYRNNLASVYVEQGLYDEALSHLAAASGEAAGHYNLGYMLNQKGDRPAALRHFQLAAQHDPSLTAAHQWIASLSQVGATSSLASGYAPAGVTPSRPATPALRTAQSVAMLPARSSGDPLAPGPSPAPGYTHNPSPATAPPPARPDYQPAIRYPVSEVPVQPTAALPPTPDQVGQGSAPAPASAAAAPQSPAALY
jgi:tetratricopeptide (TPR) repeat protein